MQRKSHATGATLTAGVCNTHRGLDQYGSCMGSKGKRLELERFAASRSANGEEQSGQTKTAREPRVEVTERTKRNVASGGTKTEKEPTAPGLTTSGPSS